MRNKLASLLPKRIATQIALLVVTSIIVAHIIVTTILLQSSSWRSRDRPRGTTEAVALVRLLDKARGSERDMIVTRAREAFPSLQPELRAATELPAVTLPEDPRLTRLRDQLGPSYPVALEGGGIGGVEPMTRVDLSDGASVLVNLPPRLSRSLPSRPLEIAAAFVTPVLILLSLWAARALGAPLSRLERAAERFDVEADYSPLKEEGPREVRAAARALNAMWSRIKRFNDERKHMLTAIGHDLRTPVTRLRLRAEDIRDEAVRAPMLRDLGMMANMIEAALSFLRDGTRKEAVTALDLSSLVQTICNDFSDGGGNVTFAGPPHLSLQGRPDELTRAITNVVQNAVDYGGRAFVRLRKAGETRAILEVEDEGPGIATAEREAMLQPFVRGDSARTTDRNTGFGLGLSIASAVVSSHSGTLSLRSGAERGLVVSIELPTLPRPGET